VRHYPWPADHCRFTSSDELLNRIWDLCLESLRWCAQEVHVDCPTREKGQYLGDLPHFAQTHVLLTRDLRLFRKSLIQFGDTSHITPGLLSIAPGNFIQEIADFSLMYPEQVEFDYWQTGDREMFERMLRVAEGVVEHFRAKENNRGLIVVDDSWNLVDWPVNLRDDYDFRLRPPAPDPAHGPHAVLNMLYIGARQCVGRLRRLIGQDVRDDIEPLRRAITEAFFDETQGCFVDSIGSRHASLHSNVLALYCGVAAADGSHRIWQLIERKRMACGPHLAYFLLHALFRAGRIDLAYDLITCHDQNSWASMLAAGATSALESWTPELKANGTWCHSWAVTPAAMIVQHVMGLRPESPGWATLRFDPQTPRKLAEASLEVVIPQGRVRVSHLTEGGRIFYELRVPRSVGVVAAPGLIPLDAREDGIRTFALAVATVH
jgi:hypothetical protein